MKDASQIVLPPTIRRVFNCVVTVQTYVPYVPVLKREVLLIQLISMFYVLRFARIVPLSVPNMLLTTPHLKHVPRHVTNAQKFAWSMPAQKPKQAFL